MKEKKIMQYIDQLAQSLNVASEHVYEALLKQALVSGIIALVWTALMLCVTVALIAVIRKAWIRAQEDPYFDDVHAAIVTGIFGVIIFIVVCFGLYAVEYGLTALLNPEYWAIKEVLAAIKN